jgi:hypothetical protein
MSLSQIETGASGFGGGGGGKIVSKRGAGI